MTLPKPEPGLVIRYSYLWAREHREGREEGSKDRPCAIILAAQTAEGETKILVVPVTHSAPTDATSALELPPGGEETSRPRYGAVVGRSFRKQSVRMAWTRPAPYR